MRDGRGTKGRSIGEVLELLRDDFPDVSVSKIRFLETQGLINPERTPSGYRQFTDEDVALLRWILVQQREHYLPLKVIRMRLREGGGPGSTASSPAVAESPGGAGGPPAVADPPPVATPAGQGTAAPPGMVGATPDADSLPAAWWLEEDAADGVAAGTADPSPPAVVESVAAAAHPPATPVPVAAAELWPAPGEARTYSRAELAREAGLDEGALAELESFGLIRRGELDAQCLDIARAAAGFFGYGVEARHLRMYKTFAEREAALFEQAVMPMRTSRQDESRARANEALAELARLGQVLRLAMLRAAIGPGD